MKPISIVTNEDNMQMMARYPDKFFDLAVVDPPYGIGEDWKKRKKTSKRFKGSYKNEAIPNRRYFEELQRVSKNWIIWGWNYYTRYLPPTNYLIAWDKKMSEKTSFSSFFELAGTSIKIPANIFRFEWDGGRKENETGITKIHPHQKPVALYSWILEKYAKEGDKILDTHLGSQSSRIAAYKKGFDFYGCELDPDYFKEGCERFEKEISMPLFDQVPELPKQLTFL